MTLSAEEQLIVRAAQVARSSPTAWQDFLEALGGYSATQTNNCVQSPLEELPRAQGRAQATARVLSLLASCLAKADEIERKRK